MLKLSPKTIALFAVTAVVVVVVILVMLGQRQSKSGGSGNARAALPPASITPTYAEKGEVVSGFPEELILDVRASVANSYALNYNQNLNQYTTTFNSDESMEELYDRYLAHFRQDGWTIVNAITKYPTSRGLYAKKGTIDASVAILDKSNSAQVSVSYVVK